MTTDKSEIKEREKHKRILFLFKVITFILLLWFSDDLSKKLLPYISIIDNVLKAAVFLLTSHIIISLGRLITVRFYLRKKGQDPFKSNFVLGINHIAGILNVVVLVISMMFLLGIDPKEFFTSITIVAAAIALLSKDYITNMINGLIIMFSDQLSLGDNVKIGEQQGKIQDVTLLNMVLVNEEADTVMIPNAMILTSQVINYSRQHNKKLTFEFEMSLKPTFEISQIEEKLKMAVLSFDKSVVKNSFTLKTIEIKHQTVLLKCQFLMAVANKPLEKEIRRQINQTIIEIAREN
ncbi:mechanosensitive ion channel [Echinicola soli]|uniref:Mechanosensitive ion channel n=1 Tax=Echinicola soli TaxID=2591634 RepID=A0A514CHK5_9BACT|nr:mechanosensitive ion channel domain-containing protein [Echinicola soli]QDH79250.1 mechanosensitive ion channel [Echinicola soli]